MAGFMSTAVLFCLKRFIILSVCDAGDGLCDDFYTMDSCPVSEATISGTTKRGNDAPRPSMADVARLASVSLGTVSNTLNNPDKVSDSTRRRVLGAIAELGFVRNDAARSLAAGTSTTVGIVLADLGNSLFVDIARGAEAALRRRGMNLLIADSAIDIDRQLNYLQTFEQARVAGIILAPLDSAIVEEPTRLTSTTPMVLVNFESRRHIYSGVVTDERRGGYLAARHLLDLGRRRIAFVGGPLIFRAVELRYEGARAAVDEVEGATLELIETLGVNIKHGKQAGRQLAAASPPQFDGVVAASDLIAIGLIQVFEETPGFSVPRDVAVVGYDNNHFASESSIPVSTVSQPGEEMGGVAAGLLLDEIWGRAKDEKQTVVLPPTVIPRKSTLGDAWRRD